jgi:hypothetical protein
VKINGVRDVEFVKQYNWRKDISLPEVELSAIASASPEEDGSAWIADVTLAGAKPVLWDADSGLPLITEFSLGKGKVYLMTIAAYPGHERLQNMSARFGAYLAGIARGEDYLEDPSGEVFWNIWEEASGVKRLFALNTDWTEKGGNKKVVLHWKGQRLERDITERKPGMFLLLPGGILPLGENHCEVVSCNTEKILLKFHGKKEEELFFFRKDGRMETLSVKFEEGKVTAEIRLS